MSQRNSIAQLKDALQSDRLEIAQQACDALVQIGGEDVADYFISLLDQDNVALRNLASLGLHDLGNNKALEPLLKAIHKPENQNKNGTIAYALEGLDCSQKLSEIFDLLFYGDGEVKMAATTILIEQVFEYENTDIVNIQTKWQEIKAHPSSCPYFEHYNKYIESLLEKFSNPYTPSALPPNNPSLH